ncbi:MAG TPA: hypothetical protein VGG49_04980 [Steroidobacteraceae bacterium]
MRASAGELDGFDGQLRSTSSGSTTYSWGLEYREPLTGHFSAGFTWLNEGHLPGTHRDGQALQLLWHSLSDAGGLVFEGGIGPYRYYDTHSLSTDAAFEDKHGWGVLASGSVDWYFANRWFTFVRLNEALVTSKYGTTALAVGVGYKFPAKFALLSDPDGSTHDAAPARPRWEFDGLLGERIGNTNHSEAGASEALGARFHLSEHFTGSVTNIAGQGTLLGWRDGFAFQLWLEERLTPRFEAGVGAGGFLVSSDDSLKDASAPSNLATMVSVSIAYSLSSRWIARAIWDRIGTGDDHDSDIVQVGIGYKF